MPPIVFYDGECGLCSSLVRWLLRADSRRLLKYSPIASELYRALVNDPAIDSMVYAQTKDGTNYRTWFYSDALIQIGFALGGVYILGGLGLSILPRPVRDWIYRAVARHRNQIAASECLVPTADTRSLFLYTWADVTTPSKYSAPSLGLNNSNAP